MNCEACSSLLAAYKHAVSLYTTSVSEFKTLDGDDFCVSYQIKESLRQARRYRDEAWMACDALMAHWREDHDGSGAKTILGNGFWLISQETEQLRQFRRDADDALIALASGPWRPS